MVGDSLTELAPWNGMFPNEEIANYGISGDTVEGVLARVPSILASHASKVLVMIGINNFEQGALGEFDHSDISHSCGGPWAQRRPGLR
jgi:lysophospholipase L1-like esterase